MPDYLPVNRKSFEYFNALSPFPDFKRLESEVQSYWKKSDLLKKYLAKPKIKGKFSFIDGPITANNPMGVHHAWGRTLKDVYLRYHNFLGEEMRYQNGFDTQGLWVEVGVEKSLKLNSKKEIYNYGLDKFKDACLERVQKYGQVITDQSLLLGQWMDYGNDYWTHTDKNIEYIWYFLKKCHEKGWLYKGSRVMPWCPRCGTSLSQHEQMDSYKDMTHPSVFVVFSQRKPLGHFNAFDALLADKFPQKLPKVSLLVWTTTPWTLPANVAVAVHPLSDYLLVRPKNNDLSWLVVGKTAFEGLSWLQKTHEEVLIFKGKLLVGVDLEGPCKSFAPKQQDVEVRVVAWDEVSETDGTGIVHIAPGCGAEDNQLGKKHNLPVLAPLSEDGNYITGFGFDGEFFSEVSKKVTEKLDFLKKLVFETTLTHRYPSCWRCHEELVYRLVDEWFINSDTVRPLLLKSLDQITWEPQSLKARMKDWLTNMGDWCISRKRFWGLPLPFYECSDCNELQVFGRVNELWRAAGLKSRSAFDKKVPDLHRPYIDKIQVKCPNCKKKITRIPEVGDCWLDASIISFSTLKYLEDKNYWNNWFPADLVLEMREQIRLWFYAMLFVSISLVGRPPYKHVVAYEKVLDEKGLAMHRSKGNVIWFQEAYEELGADMNRWFYAGWDISKPLLYGFDNVKDSIKPLLTLWSCARFLQQNLLLTPSIWKEINLNLTKVSNLTDVWLINELKTLEYEVYTLYENYKVTKLLQSVSKFWDKLSTFWLRNNRARFWVAEGVDEKTLPGDVKLAYQLLWKAVYFSAKWVAPVVPHFSEYLYHVLIRPASEKFPESVHLMTKPVEKFPRLTKNQQDALLISDLVWDLLESARQLRQDSQVKNRYRLPELYIHNSQNEKENDMVKIWKNVFEHELNVENVQFEKPITLSGFKSVSKDDWKIYLNVNVLDEWKLKWKQADVLRTVQFLRKKVSLPLAQKTLVAFNSSNKVLIKNIISDEFEEKLQMDAFVEIVPTPKKNWASKKVKGLELEVFLKN